MSKRDVFDELNDQEAHAVLRKLMASDAGIRETARNIATELFHDVDVDEISEEVYEALDSIDLDEVFENAGARRDGYVDPGDAAWQMFEEALEPFTRRLEICQELSMHEAAKLCCLGILKGIHQFKTESTSEYKEWAEDAPGEYFPLVYDQWKRRANKKDVADMKAHVSKLDKRYAKLCK